MIRLEIEKTFADFADEKISIQDATRKMYELFDGFTQDQGVLTIPEIRNKLNTITILISLIELDEKEFIDEAIQKAKESVNYLSQRDVY